MKTLKEATQIARTGQYIRCTIFGIPTEIVDYLTNGLGLIYRKESDGTVTRFHF